MSYAHFIVVRGWRRNDDGGDTDSEAGLSAPDLYPPGLYSRNCRRAFIT